MRILLVLHQNPDGYPAGIEQYILDLISGLSLRGVEICLFFPEKDSLKLRHYRMLAYEETLYKGRFTDFTSLEDQNTESVFDKILAEVKPDIVHFHSLRWLPLSLVKLTKDRGRKVVISLHEYFLWCIHFILLNPEFCGFERDERRCYECLRSQDFKIDEDFVLRRRRYVNDFFRVVDAVVSPSRYVKDKFSELYPDFDRAKCEVIELGIRKEYFGREEQFLQKHPGGPLRIGFLGNFLYHKGSKILIRLLEEFKNSKDFEFVIFGNIYDPIVTDYTNLKKYGHYSRTRIGQILNAEKIDVNLLLSVVPETFSYTLTESIASGVPVIAHDIGALRERVSSHNAGFLVPYENSVPYIYTILKDVFRHKEILDFFGEKCRENFQNILNIDDMIGAHNEFYERLLRKREDPPTEVPLKAEETTGSFYFPPGHFYSPIPSIEEIRLREEKIFEMPEEIPGIDLNVGRQLELLNVFRDFYRELPFGLQKKENLRFSYYNHSYSHTDAIFLYCMIRYLKPKRIIEVGSGHSSCVTLDTNELFFDNAISCTFIEPYPDLLLSLIKSSDKERIEVVPKMLQDVDPEIFSALSSSDILFIDSTHVSKINSDVNHIFFKILPYLKSGVYIHFHDIAYPFEYSKYWVYEGLAWNEAYLLRAFLQYNDAFSIQFFNTYLSDFHSEKFHVRMPLPIECTGASIWLKKV